MCDMLHTVMSWLAAYEPTAFVWCGLTAAYVAAVWWIIAPVRDERKEHDGYRDPARLRYQHRASVARVANGGRGPAHLVARADRQRAEAVPDHATREAVQSAPNLGAIDAALSGRTEGARVVNIAGYGETVRLRARQD